MKKALSLVRERPAFRRLWFGQIVSLLGDWLTYVAVSMLALEQGDSALAVAFVLVAHMLPNALLSPWAGAITDRFDRRTVMVASNWAQAGLTGVMVLGAATGVLVLVQVALVLRIAAATFFVTAENASIPRVVEPPELGLANSITAGTWSVMFAGGVAAGGLLVAMVGPILAIALDAFSFVAAALLLRGLPELPPQHTEQTREGRGIAGALKNAWSWSQGEPDVLSAVYAKMPLAFASGATWVYLVEGSGNWAALGAGAVALGLLHATRAIGTGVGPIVHLWAEGRGATSHAIIHAAALSLMIGISIFVFAGDSIAIALFGVLLWGMGTGSNWVKSTAMLQALVPDGYLGRLSAIDLFLSAFAVSIGAVAGALAIDSGAPARWAPFIGLILAGLAFGAVRTRVWRLHNSLASANTIS